MAQLIDLGDYEKPSMPAERAVRAALLRFKHQLLDGEPAPVHSAERLRPATRKLLDVVVDPPASGPLKQELAAGLHDWLDDPAPTQWLKLIIVAPCDDEAIIETWARGAGHQLLTPPRRDDLLQSGGPASPFDLAGDGPLVIPRLASWFLRHRNGLVLLRALLVQLATLERHCLIGCNSWAWAFLVKAAGADLMLPPPQTFAPFDAERLHHWFTKLAEDGESEAVTFRLARSGTDLMAATDDDGNGHHSFFKQLAARSAGVPWIAWHLWRSRLRADIDADGEISEQAAKATADDARTLWVIEMDDHKLPRDCRDRALLVLHALLIHDAMSAQEIDSVLPTTGEPDILPALLASGFVSREDQQFRVRAAAYPSIRSALAADGFPTGVM